MLTSVFQISHPIKVGTLSMQTVNWCDSWFAIYSFILKWKTLWSLSFRNNSCIPLSTLCCLKINSQYWLRYLFISGKTIIFVLGNKPFNYYNWLPTTYNQGNNTMFCLDPGIILILYVMQYFSLTEVCNIHQKNSIKNGLTDLISGIIVSIEVYQTVF